MANVLMIDDDPGLLESYTRLLTLAGHRVVGVGLAAEMRAELARGVFEVVITDLDLPDSLNAKSHLADLARLAPGVAVLVLTGHPSVDSAIVAIEQRLFRYLVKPVEIASLLEAVRGAAETCVNPLLARRRFDEALVATWFAWQPIVDTTTRATHGWEALVRGRVPGLSRPDELIAAAVQLDALKEFGACCRQKIAEQMSEVPDGAFAFVNLHPADLLDPGIYDPRADLSTQAHRVVLELTERSSIGSIPAIEDRISELRGLGFQIAIDDLGAGYSGLTAVAQLRPDVVKVDMGLVRGIQSSARQRAVVRSIGELCRELNIRLVAEGVEVTDERDVLSSLGLSLQQGYLFGRPEQRLCIPDAESYGVVRAP